jgi:hypothetical protein
MDPEDLVQRNNRIKKEVWQALQKLRYEEKEMDEEAYPTYIQTQWSFG